MRKRSKINLDMFLELQSLVQTKLHYRDACNSTVIEIENENRDQTIEIIKKFFLEKNIEIIFSNDNKYMYEK